MAEPELAVDAAGSWDERYQRGETGWDLGRAAPPLENWLARGDAPAPARVAVLGCGYGHDALLFARAGHTVTGFDFAPAAVKAARERAAGAGLEARFEQADIFALPVRYSAAFTLVVEHTCFCAINPRRRGEYVEVVRAILAPGGVFVGLFWAHGRPAGPPFTTSRQEIAELFTPYFSFRAVETPRDSVASRAQQELLVVMEKRG